MEMTFTDKEKILKYYNRISLDKERYKLIRYENYKNLSKYHKICQTKKRFKRIIEEFSMTETEKVINRLDKNEKILSNFFIKDVSLIFYHTTEGLISIFSKKCLKNSLNYELYFKVEYNPCWEIDNVPPLVIDHSSFDESLYEEIQCLDFATLAPQFNLPDISQEEIQEIFYNI